MSKTVSKEKVLMRTSWVSTIGNAILSASKIIVGIVAGSMAVLGDGIDSATDVVISVIMIVTAGIVSRPPSRKYPYGYQKAESVATKVLSLVIFYAGVQMLVTTLTAVISGEQRELPQMLAIYITIFSIVGKLALALYQYRQGRRIGSSLLIANAKNMRNDVLISVGVLAGLFFTFVLRLPVLDAVTGCLISLFIIKTAIGIFIESGVDLMDGVKDEAIYDKIFEAVARVPEACNPHHLRLRIIGGMYMIDLDIEVEGGIPVVEAHDIANRVEESIRASIENIYDIEIHIEPHGVHHKAEQFGVQIENRH